jgi:hypothetical protein
MSYDGLYLAKSFSLVMITFIVIIMDFKSFTVVTIIFALGVSTFGLLILYYCLENFSYMGQGYQAVIINA